MKWHLSSNLKAVSFGKVRTISWGFRWALTCIILRWGAAFPSRWQLGTLLAIRWMLLHSTFGWILLVIHFLGPAKAQPNEQLASASCCQADFSTFLYNFPWRLRWLVWPFPPWCSPKYRACQAQRQCWWHLKISCTWAYSHFLSREWNCWASLPSRIDRYTFSAQWSERWTQAEAHLSILCPNFEAWSHR